MSGNKNLISGACHVCKTPLYLESGNDCVYCPVCKRSIAREQLTLLSYAIGNSGAGTAAQGIESGIASASAGLVYLDNFLARTDWVAFANTAEISIAELDALAAAAELKFADDPLTYLLAFRCRAIPLIRKIEGLDVLEVRIIDNYRSDDNSDAFEYTDLYATVTSRIVENRDAIIAELEAYVTRAEQFGIDPALLDDMKRSLDICRTRLNETEAVTDINGIRGFAAARELRDGELAEKFRSAGIDALGTYEKALGLLNEGKSDAALHLLLAIRGYADSDRLIAEHSSVFTFGKELIEMNGRCYYAKRGTAYFDPRTAGDSPELKESCTLYRISDTVPESSPAVSGITKLIGCFGTRVYYVRQDTAIAAYESTNPNSLSNVRILDEAPRGDYVTEDGSILLSSDRSRFIIKKKLRDSEPERRGCFRRKKTAPKENRENNYSVLLVNMDEASAEVILPAVVDIMDFFGDRIFYTTVSLDGEAEFRVYTVGTGEDVAILNSGCIINAVKGGRIIYSRWAPSEYNLDLFSIDTHEKEPMLLATNVRSFYAAEDDRVYYTVGCEDGTALCSVSVTGGDAREIMQNPGNVVSVSTGWLYYTQGKGVNTVLMKVRLDGTDNMLVAPAFGTLVRMQSGCIYYITTLGELASVRTDGKSGRIIARGVSKDGVIIDSDRIYYLRRDRVARATESSDGMGLSLFATNTDGTGLVKIAHDVAAVCEHNSDSIYMIRKADAVFKVVTPVTSYERYDKKSGECVRVLRLGVPAAGSFTYKAGCFIKPKHITRDGTVTEMREVYSRKGVAASGLVLGEEEAERRRAAERAEAERAERAAERAARRKKPEADTTATVAENEDSNNE